MRGKMAAMKYRFLRGGRRTAVAALFLGIVTTTALAQKMPAKKRQSTPDKVVAEHIAALNACDWSRMMAQYDDDVEFLSKDGGMVKGREAIGEMFKKALQPPSGGGQCGMKLIPEHTVVVGDTVNVIWRAEAPFFAAPYRGSEAFETRNGLLVLQVTTWDPSAIKMKK
jgi:ketosteroid isomerase-like protein